MITITPSALSGSIKIVSSKSLSHRYVIASSLANGLSQVYNILDSDDLVATKNALIQLGVSIQNQQIQGGMKLEKPVTIDCKESGSTLRFLIPIAMLFDQEVTFIGENKLPYRTLQMYEDMFKEDYLFKHDEDKFLPLTVKGPLKSGTFELRGDVSSQFITGLLYALPLLDGDSKIVITTTLESIGYIHLTLDVLKQFGIQIDFKDNVFYVSGNQTYQAGSYEVEGDYSGAAFFIAAGIIGEKLELKGLRKDSLQGDQEMIDFVKQMGGKILEIEDGYEVLPSITKGTTIDIGQTPDLGPILMVLAALSEGKTTFLNASRLRIKESDRLEAMIQNLTILGVRVESSNDSCTIYGVKSFLGNKKVSSFKDHRIAMAMAIASIRAEGPITIDEEHVVSKSYPSFFEEFKRLGGSFK